MIFLLNNPAQEQRGSILLSIVLMMPFLIIIAALYTELTVSSLQLSRKDQMQTHAQLAADGGADHAIYEVNEDTDWDTTGGEVEFQNENGVRTTYDVTITNDSSTVKILRSTGRSYSGASTIPTSTITVEINLRAVQSGDYSVVTGVGGLFMSNSAKILGGNVFVNGEIRMTNTSQIGLSSNPVKISVAHQICPSPADATYPRQCNSGENGQPISISNSAKIFGEIKANNQITTNGMSTPGLVASTGVTPLPLPTHDRAAQKALAGNTAATTMTAAAASCSSGTKSWPANLKIIGDVTISNSCLVTVEGDVWITGKLTVKNSSALIVSNGAGTVRPNIMVDGSQASFNNSSTLTSNASSTGFQILNYWSKDTCSPDCADVTGAALADSRDEVTIDLDNSSSGPHTIFYSRWTQVNVGNSGQIGSLIGQTVKLNNSSTITFGTSTGLGSTYWVINGYRRAY